MQNIFFNTICRAVLVGVLLLAPVTLHATPPVTYSSDVEHGSEMPGSQSLVVGSRVLIYYDGSPELVEIYEQTLLGFTEDPYYEVVETFDSDEFGNAFPSLPIPIGSEAPLPGSDDDDSSYDVYVAITSDSVAAEQWAEDVEASVSDYSAFYPDPAGGHEILAKVVIQEAPDQEANIQEAGGPRADDNGDSATLFRLWLSMAKDDVIDFIVWVLEFIADLLEGLEHTTISVEFEGDVDLKVLKGRAKITISTTGAEAAEIARRLAGKLKELK